jgi:hypothetical protein
MPNTNYTAGTFRVKARRMNYSLDAYEEVEGFVEIEIDIDRLVRDLGPRAVLSIGGLAQEAGGAIRVKRVADIAGSR